MDNYKHKEVGISILNDTCLGHILNHLSISERIRVERVCKRWKTLLENSWSNCDVLCLKKNESTDEFLYKILSSDKYDQGNIIKIVNKILKKCRDYIKEVELEIPNFVNEKIMLSEIEKNCSHLESFTLKCESEEYEYEYDENILSSIFLKNKNLKELCLANINITGFSFSNLDLESLQFLALLNCNKFKKMHALKVFQKLKNVKTFKLLRCENITDIALLGIIFSGCQISEFALGGSRSESDDPKDYNELLIEFFPKQKNLLCLQMIHQYISGETLQSINPEKILKLDLTANQIPMEELLPFISISKNLQSLDISFVDGFNDQFIQALSNCEDLVEFKLLLSQPISISLRSKMYFSKLTKLTALIINTLEYDTTLTNNLLFGIGECKNLKVININNHEYADSKITNIGMQAITSLPLLEMLVVSNLNNITDKALLPLNENIVFLGCINCENIRNKGLEEVIKNCKKLDVLLISGCDDVNIDKLIKTAGKIKNKSSSTNVLQITVSEYIDIDEFTNVSPLIEVSKLDFEDFNLNFYVP